uniref:Uncharacterized protein n=1 Tax=Panagrolaimus sp. PS1159 TaxID=55785 RepID=A0AC35GD00_9BILA
MFSILAFIGFTLTTTIILPWMMIICGTKRKVEQQQPINNGPPKGGYKPGHLPEFADPDQKETNTFYDVQSVIAFPIKDNENVNGSNKQLSTTPNPPADQSKTPSNLGNVAAAAVPAKTPTNIK